jgi:hypothetical protein
MHTLEAVVVLVEVEMVVREVLVVAQVQAGCLQPSPNHSKK